MSSLARLTPRQGLLLLFVCLLLSIIPFVLNLRLNDETSATPTPTTIYTTVPLTSPTAIMLTQSVFEQATLTASTAEADHAVQQATTTRAAQFTATARFKENEP